MCWSYQGIVSVQDNSLLVLSADHLNCSGGEKLIDADKSGKNREYMQQQSTLIAQAPQIYPLQRSNASFECSKDPEV